MNLPKRHLPLFALIATLASCQTVHLDPAERAELEPTSVRWEVGVFHESSEVDEITFDDPGYINETRMDVDRKRSGARVSVGIEYVQGYLELFGGEMLGSVDEDEYGGIGLGAEAQITLHEWSDGTSLFFPYRAGVNFSGGKGDFAGERLDFAAVEAVSEIGIGVDFKGFRPSIGVTSRSLRGLLEFEGEPEVDSDDWDEDDFEDVEADTTSAYVEIAYRPSTIPMQYSVRALSGEEEGIYFGVNLLF